MNRLLLPSLVFLTLTTVPLSVDAEADTLKNRPRRVLLIGQGPDGHPRATHEYRAGVRIVAKLLSRTKKLQTVVVSADGEWKNGPELLDGADAAVLFVSEGARWIREDTQRLAAFQRLAKRGGGLVCLHWGMGTRDAKNIDDFVNLFGGCHGGPDRRYKVVDVTTKFPNPEHPILAGCRPLDLHEELYFKLKRPQRQTNFTPLINARIEGQDHTVAWAWTRPDGGRSFGYSGLHFHENWRHELYQRMIAQSVLWTLKREIPKDGLKLFVSDADLELPPAAASAAKR